MHYDDFLAWLLNEKNLSLRAAKDVISRCRRICGILNIDEITKGTLDELNGSMEFSEKSMFIKSQLRRAVNLWLEFGEE